MKNNLAVLNSLNRNEKTSLNQIKTSEKIMADTYGENSLEYVVTVLNQIVSQNEVHHDITKLPQKMNHVEKPLD